MWLLHHRCYHRCNLQGQYDNSKALRQLVWRTLLWWKNDLDSRTWLISMFSEVFSSYEHVLAALSEKQEAKFPCLYSRISFCCHFGILKKNPDFFSEPRILHLRNCWNFRGMVFTRLQPYEHVYMRPKVNSNRFEISLRRNISLRCQVTLLLAFTWVQAKWNSLRRKFHFGHFDRSEISNHSEFFM